MRRNAANRCRALLMTFGAATLTGCSAGSPAISVPVEPTPTVVIDVNTPLPSTPEPAPTATAQPESAQVPQPSDVTVASMATERSTAAPPDTPVLLPAPPVPADGEILNIYRGPSDARDVALTFDAGEDRGYAEEILDALAANGASATFGMTGKWAEANPDLVQRIVRDGHQLINHTWTHQSLTGVSTGAEAMSYDQLLQELTDTETVVRDLTGYEMQPWFRPPYGDIGPITSGYLAEAGYYVNVLWSCDSFGWNGFGPDVIVDRCTSEELGGPGAIILMHVGAQYPGDVEALPGLLDYYRANGYRFVTVEQMLQP